MTASVLIVHWNDLLDYCRDSVSPASLLLHAVRKQARLRHGAGATALLGNWQQASTALVAELQRRGCQLYAETGGEPNLAVLPTGSAGRPLRVVLAMAPDRAARWVDALDGSEWETEIWRLAPGPWCDAAPGAGQPLERFVQPHTVSPVGLYVDWHDLQVGFRHLNVPPDLQGAATGLLRRASLVGDVLDARIYGDWSAETAAQLVARNEKTAADLLASALQPRYQPAPATSPPGTGGGVTPLADDTFLGDLQQLLESPDAPPTWILVSHHSAIPHLAAAARRRGVRTVLWAADSGDLVPTELRTAVDHFVPLQTVLDLRPQTVALFIDYENVARSLQKQGFTVDPSTLARGMIERARSFGRVGAARAYADWDQFLEHREPDGRMVRRGAQRAFREAGIDTVYVLPGTNSADLQLARDVEMLLASEECPDSVVLASGDGDFCGTVEGIRRRGKEAWVWSVRSATRAELKAQATGHEWIEDFLNLDATPSRSVTASRVSVIAREWEEAANREEPRATADTADVGTGSALSPWIRLLYQIERLLRTNHWNRVAFRRLAAHLAAIEEFGPTPANAMMWLNRAKAEEMLVVEHEAHRSDRSIRITTCRLQPEHTAARAAMEVPDRAIRLLYQMLQKMPWVSFKLLRNVLLREQWLGGPPHRLEEGAIDEWINYLITDGAIAMAKEPNAENPEYPVTALRLNDEHPLTGAVVHQAVVGTRLAAERVILAVDHFLIRNRKPWMAMGALRRALDGIGREELQEVLQGLQNLGALATDSYPNPQKEHFTTGCTLNAEVDVVEDTLRVRNAIIEVVEYLQRHRSWIPLGRVDEELGATIWANAHPNQRIAWFSLLREESILELDQDGPLPPTGWGNIQCRLRVTDAVVRTVVASNPYPVEEWTTRANASRTAQESTTPRDRDPPAAGTPSVGAPAGVVS